MARGLFLVGVLGVSLASFEASAYESWSYEVVRKEGVFEVRRYASAMTARTVVSGDFEDAGGQAFRLLFQYISGRNDPAESIEMTTPVTQQAAGDIYQVAFMMPAKHTLAGLPEPLDKRVELRAEPGGDFACIRYSGFWSQSNYEANLVKLRKWVAQQGLEESGRPVWARYDPPFKPWFLRRNEIWIPVLR